MKVFVASDHAGFGLKQALISGSSRFRDLTIEWNDLGPTNDNRVDYPDYAKKVVEAVLRGAAASGDFGLLICGSGQGMAMSANRHAGIRAALAWNKESARLSRAHNNANILCLGARLLEPELALEILETFLKEDFEGGRHMQRLQKF